MEYAKKIVAIILTFKHPSSILFNSMILKIFWKNNKINIAIKINVLIVWVNGRIKFMLKLIIPKYTIPNRPISEIANFLFIFKILRNWYPEIIKINDEI